MNHFSHHAIDKAEVTLVRTGKRVRITIDALPVDRIVVDVTDASIHDIIKDEPTCDHWSHTVLRALTEAGQGGAGGGMLTGHAVQLIQTHRLECPKHKGTVLP